MQSKSFWNYECQKIFIWVFIVLWLKKFYFNWSKICFIFWYASSYFCCFSEHAGVLVIKPSSYVAVLDEIVEDFVCVFVAELVCAVGELVDWTVDGFVDLFDGGFVGGFDGAIAEDPGDVLIVVFDCGFVVGFVAWLDRGLVEELDDRLVGEIVGSVGSPGIPMKTFWAKAFLLFPW